MFSNDVECIKPIALSISAPMFKKGSLLLAYLSTIVNNSVYSNKRFDSL